MVAPANRLAALAIVIGVVAAGTLVWAVSPVPVTDVCHPYGQGSTPLGIQGGSPLGTAMAIQTPTEQTAGTDHWYNFSIQSAGGGIALGNLVFQLLTPSGAQVPPGPGWTLTVLNAAGSTIATYSLVGTTAGTWTAGGGALVSSQQMISLLTVPTNLSGDSFIVLQTGSAQNGCPLSGSISVSIP